MKKKLKKLPPKPGVYFFENKEKKIIYIGKAKNLRKRVKSYFQKKDLGSQTQLMVNKIVNIKWRVTSSELEAFLLEAKYIKAFQPKYNIKGKDDKRFLMIAISKEDFPRVYTTRKKEGRAIFFGPFIFSQEVNRMLKAIRRIFPFRTCKSIPKKPCLYYQMGLCPDCSQEKNKKSYQQTVKKIISFLNGDTKGLKKVLEKEMAILSEKLEYEKAAVVKRQIESINYVVSNWQSLDEESLTFDLETDQQQAILKEIQKIFPKMTVPRRIEAYDISNIYGKQATGSMVVFENFSPLTNGYKRFRIRLTTKPDDLMMIKEVLERRLKHKEWPLPQLMLIDGGKGQVGTAFAVLKQNQLDNKINLLGLAKKEEIIISPAVQNRKIIFFKQLILPRKSLILRLLQQVRDEAHRFARKYHLILRHESLLG